MSRRLRRDRSRIGKDLDQRLAHCHAVKCSERAYRRDVGLTRSIPVPTITSLVMDQTRRPARSVRITLLLLISAHVTMATAARGAAARATLVPWTATADPATNPPPAYAKDIHLSLPATVGVGFIAAVPD